ncbi:MAG: type II toxin-antitoxin system RelE/ParE family toxin [Bacteroidales bacterium]|nr:type II toxin-antitoxin system RelE/ParE family toxin [Bacteroidales bacterium]
MNKVRKILYFKNYFLDFFNSQTAKVKEKIEFVLFLVTVAERIPQKFFEHITGTNGLYEIRVEFQGNIYRVFCCFDEGNLVVLFNGFQKKTQKTPPEEIKKAIEIKEAYFQEKLKKRKK